MKLFLYLIFILLTGISFDLFEPTQSSYLYSAEAQINTVLKSPQKISKSTKKEKSERGLKNLVSRVQKIDLEGFPRAYNPSIIKFGNGFLLTFRHLPEISEPWISHVGIVQLDESFKPITKPQILDTRLGSTSISQSEDARIFLYLGEYYIIFNDSQDESKQTLKDRRDMFIAKLTYENNSFSVSRPLKLFHEQKYASVLWQKNWVPFEWNNQLLLSYSMDPHEILIPDLLTGRCTHLCETNPTIKWDKGLVRGGTPAFLLDGEYLAFFHSLKRLKTNASEGLELWHYFMGAYTFSSNPPFEITKMSQVPIIDKSFYTKSAREKRVVYPGGYAISGSNFYVVYGKDDCEIWVAVIDKNRLKNSLRSLK